MIFLKLTIQCNEILDRKYINYNYEFTDKFSPLFMQVIANIILLLCFLKPVVTTKKNIILPRDRAELVRYYVVAILYSILFLIGVFIISYWAMFLAYKLINVEICNILIWSLYIFYFIYNMIQFVRFNEFNIIHLMFYSSFNLIFSFFCTSGILIFILNIITLLKFLNKIQILDNIRNLILLTIVICIFFHFILIKKFYKIDYPSPTITINYRIFKKNYS